MDYDFSQLGRWIGTEVVNLGGQFGGQNYAQIIPPTQDVNGQAVQARYVVITCLAAAGTVFGYRGDADVILAPGDAPPDSSWMQCVQGSPLVLSSENFPGLVLYSYGAPDTFQLNATYFA